jgi:ABC-type branched-subunit amino acid transport system permease subunit
VRLTRNTWLTVALLAAVIVAGPVLDAMGQSYWLIALTRALLLSVLAVGTNLAWGITGIFTLGQAVFFGFGAYAAGLIATKTTVTSVVLLGLAATGAGLAGGVLVGAFLFFGRRRVGELYVGLVTLALTYALERLANTWGAIGAGNGIAGLPLPTLFGTELETGLPLFWLALAALFATLGLGAWLLRSQFALVMRAVRDDDERAEFLGYRRPVIQLAVFSAVAAIAALAGGLYALEEGFVSPSFLGVALSTQVLVYILLGGRGTLVGPVLGVLVLEVGGQRIQESLPSEWPIIVGAMLLLVILFLPGGLMDLRARFRGRSRAGAEQAAAMNLGAAGADPRG